MTIFDILLYIILPLFVIVGVVVLVILNRKNQKPQIQYTEIVNLFNKDNIQTIEYVRNKIVVTFIDYKQFDLENLKELGATGINVVANKIKFYFQEDQSTITLYEELKNHIEG